MSTGNKKNIVITGSSGYIGSLLVQAMNDLMIHNEYDISYIDIKDRGNSLNMSQVSHLNIDILIHLAALTSVTESERKSGYYYRNNCSIYSDFIRVNNVKKIIYASSVACLDDDREPYPDNVYGSTKLEGEHITRRNMTNYGGEGSVSIRFNNPYGLSGNPLGEESWEAKELALVPTIVELLGRDKNGEKGLTFELHKNTRRNLFPVSLIVTYIINLIYSEEFLNLDSAKVYELGSEFNCEISKIAEIIDEIGTSIKVSEVDRPVGVSEGMNCEYEFTDDLKSLRDLEIKSLSELNLPLYPSQSQVKDLVKKEIIKMLECLQ